MSHEKKLKEVNTMQGAISEQLKDAMAKAEEFKALLTKPLETKTITINGLSCVVQMFSDKVTVVLPSRGGAVDYYKNIDETCDLKKQFSDAWIQNKRFVAYINSPWYKRIFKYKP